MNFNLQNLFGMLSKPEVLVDPATFNDPLAIKTSWESAKRGGANFRTHEAVQVNGNRLEFRPTTIYSLVPYMVLFMGLGMPVFAGMIRYMNDKNLVFDKTMLLMIGIAVIFGGGSYFVFRAVRAAIVFDKSYGYFWKGKRDQQGQAFNPAEQKESVRLSDIHALQIIYEWVRSGGKNNTQYRSYELNLVLSSGERLNVIDHGNRAALLIDANMLAQFLSVPLWDRTEAKAVVLKC